MRPRSGLRRLPRKTAVFYAVLGGLVLAVAALAATSIYGTGSGSAASIQRTATVTRGTVQSSVSASGNISSGVTRSVSFASGGTLTSVRVAAGDVVRTGRVLATMDSTQAAANLASARAALQVARAALVSAEAGGTASQRAQNDSSLASAKLQLASAQQTLDDDEAALTTATTQLATDRRLGCLAAASATTSGGSSTGGQSTGGSQTGGGSTGPTGQSLAAAAASAPSVTTGQASEALPTSATLTGTVDPGGAATSFWFQYGTTLAYGRRTAAGTAAKGTAAVSVSGAVGGLTEATTYVYRLVARNAAGTRYGAPRTFTTATSACSADRDTITTATQQVAAQKLAVAQQQQSVSSAEAAVTSAVDAPTIAQDQAQVQQDEVTVANDEKALGATTLRAPIAGTVTAVSGDVGDTVSGGSSSSASSSSSSSTGASGAGGAGGTGGAATDASTSSSSSSSSSGLVTIENMHRLEVVAGFPEADAVKIKAGQPATVTLSALSNVEMAGRVTEIAPTPTVVSNVVTYDVTITLTSPPAEVRVGMTADVSVFVDTRSNVLLLPSAAITTVGATSTVTVLDNGKQTVQPVTIGLVGASTTQIVSGLTAGQTVVEPTVTVSSTGTTTPTFGGGGGGGFGGGGFFRGGPGG